MRKNNKNEFVVFIDTREIATENGRKIAENLRIQGVKVNPEVLEAGDYYIPPGKNASHGIVVERKEILDLIASAKTKRLWQQLQNLSNAQNAEPYIVVEGSLALTKKFTQWRPEAVVGLIMTILNDFGIKIVFTPSWYWTSHVLMNMIKRLQREKPKKIRRLHVVKKAQTPQEYALLVLASFPGISTARAEQILRTYGTLRDALDNVDYWHTLPGIGRKTARRVRQVLDAEFAGDGEYG